ncbi:protein ACCELERATED CELL DEATH 6-like [Ziziphus jujuba]|uniref:Protein ACCELERATED CELL DEATH 6-like n=1 Tax=Ziziphus jujuba TaxID=326968 RepID=A0ABM3ZUJ9_ZIZJJ|nr:protein ACCELERATED CELL DEATH 6-like [Ziziphus jujuba]
MFPPNRIKEASDNDILMATIIATVTFAAAFQMPGGYESEDPYKGLPVYRNKKLFNSFIICDSLAFGLSSASIFIHFMASMGKDTPGATHILQYVIVSTYYSILAIVGAFISALCLVSTNSKGFKVAAYVCGASFFAGFPFGIFEKCLNIAIHKLKYMERNAYEQQ